MQFQQARGLEATGQVDAATWKALGTLETSVIPVPDPEVVNREKLPRQPPDPSTGILAGEKWIVIDRPPLSRRCPADGVVEN